MSDKGTKRARNDQPEAVATAQAMLPGRDQLFLASPELQARHGTGGGVPGWASYRR